MVKEVKDYEARLAELNKRKASLKAKKVRELGELVMATGANTLGITKLAGLLVAAKQNTDPDMAVRLEEAGEAFFLSRRKKPCGGDAVDDSIARPDDGSNQPAGE